MKVGDLIKWGEWHGGPARRRCRDHIGIITRVWGDGYVDVLFDTEEFCLPEEDCELINEDW